MNSTTHLELETKATTYHSTMQYMQIYNNNDHKLQLKLTSFITST